MAEQTPQETSNNSDAKTQSADGKQENSSPSNKTSKFNLVLMWHSMMGIYLLLLFSVGYVAFWDQDFNKPENTIGVYLKILDQYKEEAKSMGIEIDPELDGMVREVMKQKANTAGDLQELASQSFNIVLGAVLAFLSGSVTLLFQRISGRESKDKS